MNITGTLRSDRRWAICSFLHPYFVVLAGLVLLSSHGIAQYEQQGSKLVGTGMAPSSSVGQSVAISADGNTAIAGGYTDSTNVGAAWIFTRSGGVWSQQGTKLIGGNEVGAANFGQSVAISGDGNTVIVGGPNDNSSVGAAWIFTRTGGVWSQEGSKLVGSGTVGNAQQGWSVAISTEGNTVLVGGISDNSGTGAAWVFTRANGTWSQQGSKLVGTGSAGGANQGNAVSLSADGNTALVSGYSDNSNVGAAWIFTRSGGVWSQVGSKLVGTGYTGTPLEGYSAALSGDGSTAIIGGMLDNSQVGAFWVWSQSNGVWTQQGGKYVASGMTGVGDLGCSVSLSSDGNTAVVGNYYDNSGDGAVWLYTRHNGVWTQQSQRIVGTGATGVAIQGRGVAISPDGTTIISGAPSDNSSRGAVWIFTYHGEPSITSVQDVPSDQGGNVRIVWNRSYNDTAGAARPIVNYGLWRFVPSGGVASAYPSGSLAKTTSVMMGMTYDFVASVPALQFTDYSYVAPTLTDSTSTGTHQYTYVVTAQTSDPAVFYISAPDSGYSVDNIPPATPGGPVLVPLANGPIQISWNKDRTDPDVGSYDVYRSTTSGFAVGPSTLLKTTTDTTVVDSTTAAGQTYYYRITTIDIHDNQSAPTVQLGNTALALEFASFSATSAGTDGVILTWTTATETNVFGYTVERRLDNETDFHPVPDGFIAGRGTSSGPHTYRYRDETAPAGIVWYRVTQTDINGAVRYGTPVEVQVQTTELAPRVFQLMQNYPNPFNPSTEVKFSVATTGRASVVVYNTIGQRVSVLFDEVAQAGQYYRASFNGTTVASGLYFVKLQSGNSVAIRKMLLVK